MPVFTPPDVEFQILAQPLIGLNVSLPWKGYGTAIFLELGALAPEKSRGHCYNKGEACIGVEWDWRVEAAGKVLYGSSNSRPKMMAGIKGLQGSTIQSLAVGGEVPELVIQFSNGHYLRSMVMAAGNPEWTIRLADGRWVYAMNGRIVNDHGEADPSEADDPVFDAAKLAASRWGVPTAEPSEGCCANCTSFIPIDGEGHFLDYGVCSAAAGPFDGRAVNRKSGCPSFSTTEETQETNDVP